MARPTKEVTEKCIRQSVSMQPEQLRRVMAFCHKADRSLSWVIRRALDDFLSKNDA